MTIDGKRPGTTCRYFVRTIQGEPVTTDLSIQCRCGALRGVARGVSSRAGYRVVCYCDDCQSFANYLETDGQILDAHGGTDIFQMSPARLKIMQGLEQLACVRLTPKGPLRWYAGCCKTPIGNTPPTRQAPFVGLIHSCINTEDQSLDEMLGHVRVRIMGRYAKGDRVALGAHDGFLFSHAAGIVWKLLKWRVRGDHDRSLFFDAKTGDPLVAARVLSDEKPPG